MNAIYKEAPDACISHGIKKSITDDQHWISIVVANAYGASKLRNNKT